MRATNRKTRAFMSISPASTPAILMRKPNNKKIIKHSNPGTSPAAGYSGNTPNIQEITQ